MPRTRAAVVLTSAGRLGDGRRAGYWLPEAAYPWLAMARAGWQVVAISTREGQPEPGGVDKSDPVQRQFLADDTVRASLVRTRRAEYYSAGDFSLVVYAGGGGALFDLAADRMLTDFTGAVVAAGGMVAACGHGVAGLLGVYAADGRGLLAGRAVTAAAPAEERLLALDGLLPFSLAGELQRHGAAPSFGEPFKPRVVRDGPVLTGQNPASAPELARAIISATAGPLPAGAT
jgi:putative intracellular protease/amidase